MSYKINSDVDFSGQVLVQGKNTGTQITTSDGVVHYPDSSGDITIELPDSEKVTNIFSSYPVSQFGELYSSMSLNITSTGYVLSFNRQIPLFMSGNLFSTPIMSIDLSTIKADPSSTTFYSYVKLQLGEPTFIISESELLESSTIMFIGLVLTNTTNINTITINKVSRIDIYRGSVNNIGSAFPISSGYPATEGGINW